MKVAGGLNWKNGLRGRHALPHKVFWAEVSFQWKKPDFLLRDPDFLLKMLI